MKKCLILLIICIYAFALSGCAGAANNDGKKNNISVTLKLTSTPEPTVTRVPTVTPTAEPAASEKEAAKESFVAEKKEKTAKATINEKEGIMKAFFDGGKAHISIEYPAASTATLKAEIGYVYKNKDRYVYVTAYFSAEDRYSSNIEFEKENCCIVYLKASGIIYAGEGRWSKEIELGKKQ